MSYSKSEYTPTIISKQNNVKIIDPNPNSQIVPHEDLFIYVNLSARQKSKTLLVETKEGSVQGNSDSENRANIELLVPQKNVTEKISAPALFKNKEFLTTDWTEIGGFNIQQSGQDFEGFGITNIDIEIKSQVAPKVVIDFVDVRGATLFQQGSCSPYGLFFTLPYPVFELTVKGYYGKATKYYLNLVKFNTKFNASTGNMESRAEFIGYSFAFLSDIIVSYVAASQYLPEKYNAPGILKEKYEETLKFYNSEAGGNLGLSNVWCNNPVYKNGCATITDILLALKNFDEVDKSQIAGSDDYKKLNDYLVLQKTYQEYFNKLNELNSELLKINDRPARTTIPEGPLKNLSYRFTFGSDEKQYSYLYADKDEKNKNILYQFFDKKNGNGTLLNAIKSILTTKIGDTSYPYEDPFNLKCLIDDANVNQFITSTTTEPSLYNKKTLTENPWFSKVLTTLGYTSSASENEAYLDLGYLLDDAKKELDKIDEEITKKRRTVIDDINARIVAKIGFNPTIRNMFTVLMCNTDAFMEILKNVTESAEKYHKKELASNTFKRQAITFDYNQDKKAISGVSKIYPWPTYLTQNFNRGASLSTKNTKQGTKEIYPGKDFPLWPEVIFVEDFIKALMKFKELIDFLNQNIEGKPGFDNYAPINPLESRLWEDTTTPIKYYNLVGKQDILKTIGERLIVSLDHTLFQPIRLTYDSLAIPKIADEGKAWSPLVKADGTINEELIKKIGSIDAFNLLNSLDKGVLTSAVNADFDTFKNDVITELTNSAKNNGGSFSLIEDTKKITRFKKLPPLPSVNIGYTITDKYYEYRSDITFKEGINIKADASEMDPNYLFKILTEADVNEKKPITITEDSDLNKNFKQLIQEYQKSLIDSTNNLEFTTKEFVKDKYYPATIVDYYQNQQLINFNKPQLYCSLAMSFNNGAGLSDDAEISSWWSGSDFTAQEKNSNGGSLVSNMGLISIWIDNYVYGINLLTPVNPDTSTGNGNTPANFIKGNNQEILNKSITPISVDTYVTFKDQDVDITLYYNTIITENRKNNILTPLVTTPMWLDNVNNFREKVKGTGYKIPEDRQYKNLAYLFLHSLKPTPLIQRLINDDGQFYSFENEGKKGDDISLTWSLRAFNTVGGMAQVPKAWLLAFGAQLWRWKEFVGINSTTGLWNLPLVCDECTGPGNMPTGDDPLIQPGYNSWDGTPREDKYLGKTRVRTNVKSYLTKVYQGTHGTDFNKSFNKPEYQSVFGHNPQNTSKGPFVKGAEFPVYFKYYNFYKGKIGGELEKYLQDGSGDKNITQNYSWRQLYIAPHHIPYVSPEIFDDATNGEGAAFIMLHDGNIGELDYITVMPNTRDKNTYFEENQDFIQTKRSRGEDGNLGMVLQYLPDGVKEIIVKNFEDWATNEFASTILPQIDPVNFNKTTTGNDTLLSSYSYKTGEKSPAINVTFSPEVVTLSLQDDKTEIKKLLTESYYVLNSTPKIWYGISNNVGDITNKFYDAFLVKEDQFNTYLKAFYDTYTGNVQKKKDELDKKESENNEGALFDTITEDDDVKLSLYRSFKSLSDKWLTASNKNKLFFNVVDNPGGSCGSHGAGKKTTLASHFQYVNRVMGDIGDLAVIDITKIKEITDNMNISLYQYISDILTENQYLFFPLPSYINYTSSSFDDNDLIDMFRPVLDISDISCGPLFLCIYAGAGSSRQLDLSNNAPNCKIDQEVLESIQDDGFRMTKTTEQGLFTLNDDLPDEIANPDDFQGGYTAFKVLYGVENQNHFKSIQLDQAEFSETAESLSVIDKISQQGGTDRTTKGQNLNSVYLTRSYSCQIESMGNMMIQPMMYFDLQGVPMFSGGYLITEVSHNIKPNNANTTFKGVRQPRATVPIITDAAIAMNMSFKGVKASTSTGSFGGTGASGAVSYGKNCGSATVTVVGDEGIGNPKTKPIRDLIASVESGVCAENYNSYNYYSDGNLKSISRCAGGKGSYNPTDLTLGQIKELQSQKKIFAIGKYQVTPPPAGPFDKIQKDLKLADNVKFGKEVQEKFGEWLIFNSGRKGLQDWWDTGKEDALKRAITDIACEFASFPKYHKCSTPGNCASGKYTGEIGYNSNAAVYGGIGGNPATSKYCAYDIAKRLIQSWPNDTPPEFTLEKLNAAAKIAPSDTNTNTVPSITTQTPNNGVKQGSYMTTNTITFKKFLTGQFDFTKHPLFEKIPSSLSYEGKEVYLQKDTIGRLALMHDAAIKEIGIDFKVVSGTRNYDAQKGIWNTKYDKYIDGTKKSAQISEQILLYSSMPGTSRHHWGTDFDVTLNGSLDPKEWDTLDNYKKLYDWLVKNGSRFGMYQTYNNQSGGRLGYNEEKWHWSFLPKAWVYLSEYNKQVTDKDIASLDFKGANVAPVVPYKKTGQLGFRVWVNGVSTETKNYRSPINDSIIYY